METGKNFKKTNSTIAGNLYLAKMKGNHTGDPESLSLKKITANKDVYWPSKTTPMVQLGIKQGTMATRHYCQSKKEKTPQQRLGSQRDSVQEPVFA